MARSSFVTAVDNGMIARRLSLSLHKENDTKEVSGSKLYCLKNACIPPRKNSLRLERRRRMFHGPVSTLSTQPF